MHKQVDVWRHETAWPNLGICVTMAKMKSVSGGIKGVENGDFVKD